MADRPSKPFQEGRATRVYFCTSTENGVVTVAPVAKKNCASAFQVPVHFFGATISGYFRLPFLMVFLGVLVSTRDCERQARSAAS